MPFSSIQDLKTSPLYTRSDTLRGFSQHQLQRFMEVFNAAFNRVLDRGGGKEHAEATAIAIALSAAKRASPSVNRNMEHVAHFFAAMAPQQLGGSSSGIEGRVMDFTWIVQNPDLASIAVAGNEFNFEHDRQHTALGQIRGVILTKDAPADVRAKTHKDIPFLFVASYYEDTDPQLKQLDTISAEWASLSETDGIEIPLPLSFAVTRTPLNGPELGIQRVASLRMNPEAIAALTSTRHETVKKDAQSFMKQRGTMPKTPEEQMQALQDRIAALEKELKDAEKSTETLASLQATVTKFKGLEGLSEALAALGKSDKPVDSTEMMKKFEASLKVVSDERVKLVERVAAMERERLDEKASKFATTLVAEGRIPADAATKWASLFVSDAKMATDLAASLPQGNLGEFSGKSKSKKEEESMAALVAEIDPSLAAKMKKAGES